MDLRDRIREMDEDELFLYVEGKSREMGIDFDPDLLDGKGEQALYNFIADYIHPELQGELHSECQLTPGCSMFPETDTDEDLEEEMEHLS